MGINAENFDHELYSKSAKDVIFVLTIFNYDTGIFRFR